MIQHEITGLGPVNPDGSVKLFTRLPAPFIVTKEWLAEQGKFPAVGDILEVNTSLALRLVTEAQAAEDEISEQPNADGTQKKSDGVKESGSGSDPSPFKAFQGKPVIVHAAEITGIDPADADGDVVIIFADDSGKLATPEMMSRITPKIGDYWVMASQADGMYEYLNPKEVFEAKYQPLTSTVI